MFKIKATFSDQFLTKLSNIMHLLNSKNDYSQFWTQTPLISQLQKSKKMKIKLNAACKVDEQYCYEISGSPELY